MSTFGYRRGLSKYESIDEDELLASLSAEELKELERELEDLEPDHNLPVGLRQKSLTEKTPTGTFSREALMAYWEKESQKLLEKERLGECGQVGAQDFFLGYSHPHPLPRDLFSLTFQPSSRFFSYKLFVPVAEKFLRMK